MDSEPETSKDHSPPGTKYDDASEELKQIFMNSQPFIEGPLADEWGLWVSGSAVRDPADGQVIAALAWILMHINGKTLLWHPGL